MDVKNRIVLITGSNRGIGRALVDAALQAGAARVYAAARATAGLEGLDARVIPLRLDLNDAASIAEAARRASDVDVLINNAGVAAFASVLTGQLDTLRRDLETNYFGTLQVVRAFAPALIGRAGATVANVLSVVSYASMPALGGYSASKAALFSATQALRAELAPKGVAVVGIFPGPVETDMTADESMAAMAKATPQEVAQSIIEGLRDGAQDIYPDPTARHIGALWAGNPKAVEREFSGLAATH